MAARDDLVIRPYAPLDREALVALWRACNLVVPWNDPDRDIDAKLAWQPDLLLVGLVEGRIVTSVMAGYEGHRGWLNYLAVAPDMQGQGLGRAIVSAAEARLSALGCQKINLQVRETNTQVIAFYQRLGYSVDAVVSLGKRIR